MKNNIKMLTALSFLSTVFSTDSFGANVKIANLTDDNIQMFFRGKNSSKHHIVTLPANVVASYEIKSEHIENKPVFEAIASKGNGGDPDWKLLGGACTNLEKDKDYTLLIENSLGGIKTSCTSLVK